MRSHRNMSQMKEQNKALEKELNKIETSNLPDAELKTLVIIMLSELNKTIDDLRENFIKDIENIKKELENKK